MLKVVYSFLFASFIGIVNSFGNWNFSMPTGFNMSPWCPLPTIPIISVKKDKDHLSQEKTQSENNNIEDKSKKITTEEKK